MSLPKGHRATVVFRDADAGDLIRCLCGEQGYDFVGGLEWFPEHILDVWMNTPKTRKQRIIDEFIAATEDNQVFQDVLDLNPDLKRRLVNWTRDQLLRVGT